MIDYNILALDCETAYGNNKMILPWDKGFYLTCVGLLTNKTEEVIWFDHEHMLPTPNGVDIIQAKIDEADIILGHNLKFDINVLRYIYGIRFKNTKLFCTQVADYIIRGQDTTEYSFSLDAVSKRYGLKGKIDKVKSFWEDGTDTNDIPDEILHEYVLDDCKKPYELFPMMMKKIMELRLEKVIQLDMEYIYSLSDMECNGFRWDKEKSDKLIEETTERFNQIEGDLLDIIEIPHVNIGSSSQLCAILYGGLLKTAHTEWTRTEYKNGNIKEHDKVFTNEWQIDGLGFTPPKGSASKKKEGVYSTDKTTINKLRCVTPNQKMVKKLLLELSVEKKVLSTLKGKTGGLSTKVKEDGFIHTNFNQTVTKTSRLSSSDPNGQNLPRGNTSPIKTCIIGRE